MAGGEGLAWRGLLEVALTRLQFLLVRVRTECVVGRDGLGYSIDWFAYVMELGTELTGH